MGAIASAGIQVRNEEVIERLGIPDDVVSAVAAREDAELRRRERAYRDEEPPLALEGRTVVLVDDGLATGSTMRAAIAAARRRRPEAVVVAVPTAPRATVESLRAEADAVVAAMTPEPFHAVGHSYVDFDQTTDHEVRRLVLAARTSSG